MVCDSSILRPGLPLAVTTQVIKLFASIRKGNFFSSFGGKRSKTISF